MQRYMGIVMIKVSSTSNEKYKHIKSLLNKKSRETHHEYTVEGIKSVRDAISAEQNITFIVVSDKFYEEIKFNYPSDTQLIVISDNIFAPLCDTKTPQGILAVIKMPEIADYVPKKDGKYIYCDDVRDPGNIGTIIRTAEAAGFDAVMLSPDCVDIYSPKVVRASMGSYFNIKIVPDIGYTKLEEYKNAGMNLLAGALSNNSKDYAEADYSSPCMIVVGNEANGVSDDVLRLCNCVKIPIYGQAESLNVSVAAGILIYELIKNEKNN